MHGTLFFVVGPSGIGKDTLLNGAKAALADDPDFVFARRTITRPADVGDEGHLSVTEDEFARIHDSGGFLVSWSAHGLRYGIPVAFAEALAQGRNVVINGSRAAVPDLLARMPNVVVIEITAPAELVAQRMRARGREDAQEMAARLARVTPPLPDGARAVVISNDADIATGVARLVSALRTHGRRQRPQPVRSTDGARALRAKLAGEELSEEQYRVLLGEFVQRKHSEDDLKQFLIAATRSLSIAEIAAIARVRAEFATAIGWDEPIVVDKHSMGGVPGSRITMIVVPIIAAHGLAIPKTSSRAITSAAGTADAMETVSRVDLDRDAVRRVVSVARGCIAWNGRLNHSALDEVMNAITRPLGLDSTRWSVASILSKKLAAGVTHLIVDLPYGPYAKVKEERAAEELARLFREVGGELGLNVEVCPSEGFAPIGRGIGPALEVRDVLDVLEQRPSAPQDLRDKALKFAGRILRWAPDISSEAAANARAAQLLASGAAKEAFERIVDAQGRRDPRVIAGALTAPVLAPRSGVVACINGWRIAGIARQAGAPGDAGAGLDLLARCGDTVRAGEALYVIHAGRPAELAAAAAEAAGDSGFDIR